MGEERSIHRVRVRTPARTVTIPWDSAQDFLARAIAAYPTTHPVVERFRAVGTSRPVELLDPGDRDFALAVIDARSAEIGDAPLPPGVDELRAALRGEA
jgi:hypothetical protein